MPQSIQAIHSCLVARASIEHYHYEALDYTRLWKSCSN